MDYNLLIITGVIMLIGVLCYFFIFRKKKVTFTETYVAPSILGTLDTKEKFEEYLKKNYIDLLKIDEQFPLVNVFGRLVPVNSADYPAINNKGDTAQLESMRDQFPEAINQFTKLKSERERQLADTIASHPNVYKAEEKQKIVEMIKTIIASFDEILQYLKTH